MIFTHLQTFSEDWGKPKRLVFFTDSPSEAPTVIESPEKSAPATLAEDPPGTDLANATKETFLEWATQLRNGTVPAPFASLNLTAPQQRRASSILQERIEERWDDNLRDIDELKTSLQNNGGSIAMELHTALEALMPAAITAEPG